MLKPFDKDILHMLGGRAKADADAGLTMSRVETEYLAELCRLAGRGPVPTNKPLRGSGKSHRIG